MGTLFILDDFTRYNLCAVPLFKIKPSIWQNKINKKTMFMRVSWWFDVAALMIHFAFLLKKPRSKL